MIASMCWGFDPPAEKYFERKFGIENVRCESISNIKEEFRLTMIKEVEIDVPLQHPVVSTESHRNLALLDNVKHQEPHEFSSCMD